MTRIGLLYPNAEPTSPANWSGTPKGLSEGFRALRMDVIPIPCNIPRSVRFPLALLARARGTGGPVARRQPLYVKVRSIALASALRRAGQLDAIVAMGTDVFDLTEVMRESNVPVATYDDGNFTLFLRYENSDLRLSGFPIGAVQSWARRQAEACKRANVACVSTNWAKRSIVDDFGVPEKRVRVVGMGHRPRSTPREVRNWASPRFLFVGVDWKRKNGQAVVNAFACVREQFPEATLDLVGEHPPVDLPGVTGHGFLPRESATAQQLLDRLFARATSFVLPSLFDPSPISYLEAASAGLPVVGTTCGGASELLQDAAISVNPQDQEALIRAMLQLSNMDTARSMGALAHARATRFTWQAVSGRIADSLLGETWSGPYFDRTPLHT